LYIARKGKGAYKNGKPIHASQRPLSRAWIELSVPLHKNSDGWKMVTAVRDRIAGFSVIRDFTLAAEGKIDGHLIYSSGGGAWDFAPRALLMAEAGGKVTNIGKSDYDYTDYDMLLANPVIFDEIKEIIDSSI
ncbi:MAG: inositol monophosphatase family protein, partial [Minisyncoccia bacterium]